MVDVKIRHGSPRPPGSVHPAALAAVAVLVVLVAAAIALAGISGKL